MPSHAQVQGNQGHVGKYVCLGRNARMVPLELPSSDLAVTNLSPVLQEAFVISQPSHVSSTLTSTTSLLLCGKGETASSPPLTFQLQPICKGHLSPVPRRVTFYKTPDQYSSKLPRASETAEV